MQFTEVENLPVLDNLIESGAFYKKYEDYTLYFWEHVGEFLVKKDGSILIKRDPEVTDEVLHNYLTGSILPAAHAYTGNLVLHGSCIRVGGTTIGFLGYSGMGKSTTAKAMILRGHQLISDDNLMVNKYNPVEILAGENHMRLWKDALEHFEENTEKLNKLHPKHDKHVKLIENHTKEVSLKLDILFVLGYGRKHEIIPLTGALAVTELVAQCKGLLYITADREVQHFFQCSQIAQQIPVYRLKRRRGLNKLDKLCALIEDFVNK